jgi:hypothetical protein
MTRALGRHPHNPETVARAPSLGTHTFAAMAPPDRLVRTDVPFAPQLRNNNTLPVCTAVGLLNGQLAVEALNTSGELAIAEGVELAFYAGCVGCSPTKDAITGTDGANLLDVLRRQSVQGFDIGAAAPMTADPASITVTNRSKLANSMALLGVGLLGGDLYQRDMDTAGSQTWDVDTDGSDPGALVGGHCLVAWSYTGLIDTDTLLLLGTWGSLQQATWRWARARLREAYALF